MSDSFVKTCKFVGDRCQDLDLGAHYNFSITLNNLTKLHVPVKSFAKSERLLVNHTDEQNNCIIMIYHRHDLKDQGVILGNSFFENYYVLWDFDSMTLGFNGYFETLKPDPIPPTPPSHKGFPGWATALLIIVGLASIGVIGWLLYKRYKEKTLREQFL